MRRVLVLPWVFAAICVGVALFTSLGPAGCHDDEYYPPHDGAVFSDAHQMDVLLDREPQTDVFDLPKDGAIQDGQHDVLLPDGQGDADALTPHDAAEDEAG